MPSTLMDWISVGQGIAFIIAVVAVYFKHKAMTDANTTAINQLRKEYEDYIEEDKERRKEDKKSIEDGMHDILHQVSMLNGDVSGVKELNFAQQLDMIHKGVDEIRKVMMECPWRTRRPSEFSLK